MRPRRFYSTNTERLIAANRVIMGSTDAVAYVEQVAKQVMKPLLGKGVKVWLDNVLGYAETDFILL